MRLFKMNNSIIKKLSCIVHSLDYQLILLVIALSGTGMLIMYSAGYDNGLRFFHHGRNILIALTILFIVAMIPTKWISMASPYIYMVGVLLLFAVLLFGITRKGAQRWVNVGIVIQPSEILKIGAPLMLAWWFHYREKAYKVVDFIVAFILLCIPFFLIAMQPDLGTSLLVLAAGLTVIFFAGLSWKIVIPIFFIGFVGISMIIFFEERLCQDGGSWYLLRDYQRTRVCTLLDPTKDPLGRGFHILQSMIAIGSGGIWGKGFMAGTQTHLEFIPERTTDFIFAAYSEEFGLFGNVILLLLMLMLVWKGLHIALKASDQFSRLIATAISMIFFTYSFVNIGMVSGILPVVGVPLPFISYGGTAMVTLGLALGILMSISRESKQKYKKIKLI